MPGTEPRAGDPGDHQTLLIPALSGCKAWWQRQSLIKATLGWETHWDKGFKGKAKEP